MSEGYECLDCGYKWAPVKKPVSCSKCGSESIERTETPLPKKGTKFEKGRA